MNLFVTSVLLTIQLLAVIVTDCQTDDEQSISSRQIFIPRMGKLLRSRGSDDQEENDSGEMASPSKPEERSVPPLPRLGKFVVRMTDEEPVDYEMERHGRQIYMKTPRVGRSKRSSREERMLPRMGYRQLNEDEGDDEEAGGDDQRFEMEDDKRASFLPRHGYFMQERQQRAAPFPRLGQLKRAVGMLRMGRAPDLMERMARRTSMLRMGKRAVSMLRMGRASDAAAIKRAVSMLRMGRSDGEAIKRRVSMLRMGRAVSMLRMGKRSSD